MLHSPTPRVGLAALRPPTFLGIFCMDRRGGAGPYPLRRPVSCSRVIAWLREETPSLR
jgi:hypothetical protein